MDLVLIRHPAVAVEAGVCYGATDVALRDDAAQSAARIAARLAALNVPMPPRMLFTSPLTRCASVAQALSSSWQDIDPQHDARLMEMDFGAWESQRWDEIERAQIDAWTADFDHARPHDGESVAQFAARIRQWLDHAMQLHREDSPLVVVAHAGTLRVLASAALNVPLAQCLRWSLEFAAIVWLHFDEATAEWTLQRWNA